MHKDLKINSCNLQNRKPYIAVAMYTEKYTELALRLQRSLIENGLDYCIFKVPTVHKSISPNGSDNLFFCKPNFIIESMKFFGKPVLYLDCDTVIRENPLLIDEISERNIDFSIYNWLASSDNSAYVPVDRSENDPELWQYSHSIDYEAKNQLICSGAVQYWSDSFGSIKLLNDWATAIQEFPGTQDDHCLDFAFNNYSQVITLKYFWLPEEYSRYAWWIFKKPIIDHPQIPFSGNNFFKQIKSNDMRERCYIHKMTTRKKSIQKVVNVKTGEIYEISGQILIKIGNAKEIWL